MMNPSTTAGSVGDSFGWPFQGPDWFGRMVIQGLIWVIPIIGWIALAGWLMRTVDDYRAGRRELAHPGFHLGRGAPLFLVLLIYGVVLDIPGGVVNGISSSTGTNGLSALAGILYLAAWLLLTFLTPVIVLFVYRGGFAGGFDLAGIWSTATGNLGNTIAAAAAVLGASIIGGLGWILCCVGLLFTVPYGQAVIAGAVSWYERVTSGPAPAAPPTPNTG